MPSSDDGAPCVTAFLGAVEAGAVGRAADVFSDAVILDATVPNWRFTVCGAEAVSAELGRWYADPGQFEELTRTALPDGELVEFLLTWTEAGVPHAAHQAHRLRVEAGRITHDTAWCGGRWPASLVAEMEAAATAGG